MKSNINEKDIKKFYDFLKHEKETELRFIKEGTIHQKWINNFESFLKEIKDFNGQSDIYVGFNERLSKGDKDDDVPYITKIGHDIDAHGSNPEDFVKAQEIALKIGEDCIKRGYEKPLIFCSGRGFWVIHDVPPIINNFQNVKKIKAFAEILKKKYEIEGVELDSTVYNPSRIVRVPGTINIKHPNKIIGFIIQESSGIKDEILKEKILSIELEVPKSNINAATPKSSSSFMDFCLTHEIPKGERHKTISRNMALYICEHPNRELLREQYIKIQKGSEKELDGWLKNIDENGKEKYPFSVGELINFTKKYKIPFDWKTTPEYNLWKKEKKAERNLAKAIEIEKKENYTELQKEVLININVKDFSRASELLVKEIKLNNYIYSTRDDIKSEMWIYDGGVYKPNGKTFVKEFCRKVLGEAHSQYIVNLVLNKVEADTFIDQIDFFENKFIDELPVQNGILNVKTKELKPFNHSKIFFNKLPVEYNEGAKCPNIDKFLRDILSREEDVDVAYELIGSGLFKEYFTEKAGMLVGNGRNGKSKFLELIRRLIGIENCSSVPIRSMKEDNSSLCELHGKLFNLAGDLSGGDLKEVGVFKQTVGRDTIQAHRKFLRDLFFINYAKHIFACNELPRVFDHTDGFWTKWILLEFPFQFITEEELRKLPEKDKINKKIKDPEIIDKISSSEELSGLFNLALDGLDRLFKHKDFSQTKGTKEIKDFWIRKSDSFTAFCIDCIKDDYESFLTKKIIRKRFSAYCKKHRLKGAGDKDIKSILQDRYGVGENRKMVNQDYEFVWEGIKFKSKI